MKLQFTLSDIICNRKRICPYMKKNWGVRPPLYHSLYTCKSFSKIFFSLKCLSYSKKNFRIGSVVHFPIKSVLCCRKEVGRHSAVHFLSWSWIYIIMQKNNFKLANIFSQTNWATHFTTILQIVIGNWNRHCANTRLREDVNKNVPKSCAAQSTMYI